MVMATGPLRRRSFRSRESTASPRPQVRAGRGDGHPRRGRKPDGPSDGNPVLSCEGRRGGARGGAVSRGPREPPGVAVLRPELAVPGGDSYAGGDFAVLGLGLSLGWVKVLWAWGAVVLAPRISF